MKAFFKTVVLAVVLSFGVATAAEAASWAAIKRAQCLRNGGAYCR